MYCPTLHLYYYILPTGWRSLFFIRAETEGVHAIMDNLQNTGIQTISDADAERIADSLAAALDSRRQRAERSVINSFARQNNLSTELLESLIRQRSQRQSPSIPADVQAIIDKKLRDADDRLIRAEIRNAGSQLGLIDSDAAFALMDKSAVGVGDDGSVYGVRESLAELLKDKPYLASRPSGSTGRTGNFPRQSSDASVYASQLAHARDSGNNSLAAAIISEAASNGILLR